LKGDESLKSFLSAKFCKRPARVMPQFSAMHRMDQYSVADLSFTVVIILRQSVIIPDSVLILRMIPGLEGKQATRAMTNSL
jgi:hypothetical protein